MKQFSQKGLVKIYIMCFAVFLFIISDLSSATEYSAIILHPEIYDDSIAYEISGNYISGSGEVRNGPNGYNSLALSWNLTNGYIANLNPSGSFFGSIAYGVSNTQHVGMGCAGWSDFSDPPYPYGVHALYWPDPSSQAVDLHPNSVWWYHSEAHGTFNGKQVGWGSYSDMLMNNYHRALLWEGTSESVINLHPEGYYASFAYGIRENQQVGMGVVNKEIHALLWYGSADSVVDLHFDGTWETCASDVSDGQQVGYGRFNSTYDHALLWHGTAESVIDLHPNGYFRSRAESVSNGRQVGWASVSSSFHERTHALLWSGTAESVVDLHNYLPENYLWSKAYGIDEVGNIVGYAETIDGYRHAVLWQIPEPTSLVLIVFGSISLRLNRKRYFAKRKVD